MVSMRKMAMSFTTALLMAGAANAADFDKNPALSKSKQAGRCAAIAFSSEPDKPDGWGAESFKDTCEAAAASAVAYCEDNLRKNGYPNGRCERVEVSRAWIVGIVCHSPNGRYAQGLGVGETPVDAIRAAFSQVGDAPAVRCGTTLIRSAMHRWRDFYPTVWSVRLSCGSAITAPSELKGFTALTRAILSCGRQPVSSCHVHEASFRGSRFSHNQHKDWD